MDSITIHVPTVQFGYIEVSRDFALENKEALFKESVEDFKTLYTLWNSPQGTKAKPEYLGQTCEEHGHTYRAVENQQTGKLYWLIEEI